jgi:hypothetical protein
MKKVDYFVGYPRLRLPVIQYGPTVAGYLEKKKMEKHGSIICSKKT